MAVIDPVKLVIENYQGEGEMVTMPNHPNKPEWAAVRCRLAVRFGLIAPISAKKLTSQYKRLVLGKEVRLRNAYVIKQNASRKMPKVISPPSSVLMTPIP
ncbi:glutaminyl-tRNA synthetase [Escherichia coli]|nr:glutaminyl-tRNA synthetase [Escherichia coli]